MNNKQHLVEKILNQSLAIRTFPIRPVEKVVHSHSLEQIDQVKKFKSDITKWLEPVCDLSGFDHLYFTNGITEAMNYWMWQNQGPIQMEKDDYQWVSGSVTGDIRYVSNPASYDGNYVDIPTDKPVVLDLAYIGSSTPARIEIPDNVIKVFFSLSKSFGLRNYRIGYYWSRKADHRLELIQNSAKYYNYHSASLGEAVISEIGPHDVYKTLRSYQLEICEELDLTPSDSVWLATTDDPQYIQFFRNYTNRICIADIIKERYHATTRSI